MKKKRFSKVVSIFITSCLLFTVSVWGSAYTDTDKTAVCYCVEGTQTCCSVCENESCHICDDSSVITPNGIGDVEEEGN
jgi:hypothetical protein